MWRRRSSMFVYMMLLLYLAWQNTQDLGPLMAATTTQTLNYSVHVLVPLLRFGRRPPSLSCYYWRFHFGGVICSYLRTASSQLLFVYWLFASCNCIKSPAYGIYLDYVHSIEFVHPFEALYVSTQFLSSIFPIKFGIVNPSECYCLFLDNDMGEEFHWPAIWDSDSGDEEHVGLVRICLFIFSMFYLELTLAERLQGHAVGHIGTGILLGVCEERVYNKLRKAML